MTFPPMELGSNYLRRNVPFQENNDKIGNMLKPYGEVYKCQNYYKKICKYINFNSSGDMIAWVKLKKNIHQSLFLKETLTSICVQYPNQLMSCKTEETMVTKHSAVTHTK